LAGAADKVGKLDFTPSTQTASYCFLSLFENPEYDAVAVLVLNTPTSKNAEKILNAIFLLFITTPIPLVNSCAAYKARS